VTLILIHLENRSGSGRDGKFAHTSNGHMVCVQGRAIEKERVEKKTRGSLLLGISGKLGDRGFEMNGGLTIPHLLGFLTYILPLSSSFLAHMYFFWVSQCPQFPL